MTRRLTMMMTVCLQVWHLILARNRGLHFSFILGHLPLLHPPIYVDASLTGGIGGYCGLRYFSWSIEQLKPWLLTCEGWESFPNIDIAWLELFAACAALYTFAPRFAPQRLLTLFSDNMNVVAWLTKRRAPNPYVCAVVAAMERIKYNKLIKISTRYISTVDNTTADQLSRGDIPEFLYTRGHRATPPMKVICTNLQLNKIVKLWTATINSAPFPTQV